jgi:hypothetical protein
MSQLPFIHAADAVLAPIHLSSEDAARHESNRPRTPQFVTVHDWVGATAETPARIAVRRIYLATEVDRVDFYAG